MLTRITRYTLLVLCLLVIAAWGWSVRYANRASYAPSDGSLLYVASTSGLIVLNHQSINRWLPGYGFKYSQYQSRSGADESQFGFIWPQFRDYPEYHYWIIPYWVAFLPIFLATLLLWYPQFKKWRRGTDATGFEVEPKQPEPAKE